MVTNLIISNISQKKFFVPLLPLSRKVHPKTIFCTEKKIHSFQLRNLKFCTLSNEVFCYLKKIFLKIFSAGDTRGVPPKCRHFRKKNFWPKLSISGDNFFFRFFVFFGVFQVGLGQFRLGQVRLGQFRLGQVRQVRLGQVRLGQIRTGYGALRTFRVCGPSNLQGRGEGDTRRVPLKYQHFLVFAKNPPKTVWGTKKKSTLFNLEI